MTRVDLRTLALGAVGALAWHTTDGISQDEDTAAELRHLTLLTEQLGDPASWLSALRKLINAPTNADRALTELAKHLHLTLVELLTLRIAVAVEEDALVCRAIARLQAPVAGSYPSLGLLEHALAPFLSGSNEQPHPINLCAQLAGGNAVHTGVLTLCATESPLPERTMRIPQALALALAGAPNRDVTSRKAVQLPETLLKAARGHARSLAANGGVLLVRSGATAESFAAAAEVCAAAGKRPLPVDIKHVEGLAALCFARDEWPVLELDLGPGDSHDLKPITGHPGPMLVTVGKDGHVRMQHETMLEWQLEPPDVEQRTALWQAVLDDPQLAKDLGQKYLHGSSRIAEVASRAVHDAHLAGRDRVTAADVHHATRTTSSGMLSGMTQPVTSHVTDTALVVGSQLKHELEFLTSRCRQRESLDQTLGETIRTNYHRGVRALFVGPSGTGKTLAASWLATRLGMPLYRVDLSSIISKYIGETEKNLAAVLAEAELSDVILLFDEADSIFAKRTDVRDSNDRHANTQTNYLLQRIETYNGIVLLTSNSKTRFDKAFARRLDSVIEFSLPTPDLRRDMWSSHLGDQHRLTPAHLNQLAVESSLVGGQIRTAVLGAAVLAAERCAPIEFEDVLTAVVDEYRKLGQQPPVSFKKQLTLISHVQ